MVMITDPMVFCMASLTDHKHHWGWPRGWFWRGLVLKQQDSNIKKATLYLCSITFIPFFFPLLLPPANVVFKKMFYFNTSQNILFNFNFHIKQHTAHTKHTTNFSVHTALDCSFTVFAHWWFTSLHCTTLHCNAPHYTEPYCTSLHWTAVHCTVFHHTTLHYTASNCMVLIWTLHYTAPVFTLLHVPWIIFILQQLCIK